jgi:hypothetical protein
VLRSPGNEWSKLHQSVASAAQNVALPGAHMMPILTFQWDGNFVAASSIGNDLGVSALLDSGAVQTTVSHWALEIYDKDQIPKIKDSNFALMNLEKRRVFGWSTVGVAAPGGFLKIVEMLLLNEPLDKKACN